MNLCVKSGCREMVMQKAKQLQETKVEVLLFNLTPPDKEFSMSFWSGIVHDPDFPSEPRAINIEVLLSSLYAGKTRPPFTAVGILSVLAFKNHMTNALNSLDVD